MFKAPELPNTDAAEVENAWLVSTGNASQQRGFSTRRPGQLGWPQAQPDELLSESADHSSWYNGLTSQNVALDYVPVVSRVAFEGKSELPPRVYAQRTSAALGAGPSGSRRPGQLGSAQAQTSERLRELAAVSCRATDAREKGRIGITGSNWAYAGSSPRVTSDTIGRDINPLGRGDGNAYVGGELNLGRIAPPMVQVIDYRGTGNSVNNQKGEGGGDVGCCKHHKRRPTLEDCRGWFGHVVTGTDPCFGKFKAGGVCDCTGCLLCDPNEPDCIECCDPSGGGGGGFALPPNGDGCPSCGGGSTAKDQGAFGGRKMTSAPGRTLIGWHVLLLQFNLYTSDANVAMQARLQSSGFSDCVGWCIDEYGDDVSPELVACLDRCWELYGDNKDPFNILQFEGDMRTLRNLYDCLTGIRGIYEAIRRGELPSIDSVMNSCFQVMVDAFCRFCAPSVPDSDPGHQAQADMCQCCTTKDLWAPLGSERAGEENTCMSCLDQVEDRFPGTRSEVFRLMGDCLARLLDRYF